MANDLNDKDAYSLPQKKKGIINPLSAQSRSDAVDEQQHLAANLVRQKLTSIYANEPGAKEELKALETLRRHRSKHQQFMYDLSNSGRSLAEIQTAWHNYYTNLPDNEKHQVWQEFYANHAQARAHGSARSTAIEPLANQRQASSASNERRSVADIKKHLAANLTAGGKLQRKHHVQSLVFGLGMGGLVVLVLLFGFFNERFIAPFITPSKSVSSTPIIIDPNSTAATTSEPKVIIPKINVEVPVVYDAASTDEKAVQKALERGVVHYTTTPKPGEQGNLVIVGHSSNNILNRGQYKFAFVLLNRLSVGDTFMLNYEGKRYVYKVYDKKIVKPTDLGVLGKTDKPASVTLITCDPPGTSINRLVVLGEQISPDPLTNVASASTGEAGQAKIIPGNAPSLWQRFKNWLFS